MLKYVPITSRVGIRLSITDASYVRTCALYTLYYTAVQLRPGEAVRGFQFTCLKNLFDHDQQTKSWRAWRKHKTVAGGDAATALAGVAIEALEAFLLVMLLLQAPARSRVSQVRSEAVLG